MNAFIQDLVFCQYFLPLHLNFIFWKWTFKTSTKVFPDITKHFSKVIKKQSSKVEPFLKKNEKSLPIPHFHITKMKKGIIYREGKE